MCSSGDAPFLLQVDAFSCRDTRDFNSLGLTNLNVHLAFTYIGGCASTKDLALRSNFAVAKLGNG